MMPKLTLKGQGITSGAAEGEALVTSQPFGFAHGLEPATGRISDESHEWRGQDVRAKVLVYPHGKGSSSGGLYILEAVRRGNAPAAVITLDSDPVSAAGFILAKLLYEKEIPVIGRPEQNAVEVIKTGDWVRVDADHGIIEILASGLGRRT